MAPTGGFDTGFIEEVRAHSDIVTVISEYVSLRRAGKNYVGLCPFHQERTPSFNVSPERQMFYCFGCHAGGDVFAFLMKKEGLDFPSAVAELARRAGIPLPETGTGGATRSRRQRLLTLVDAVASLYHDVLLHDEIAEGARRYLAARAIGPKTVEQFRLGYAPQAWDTVVRWAREHGYDPADLAATGLAAARERGQGGYYDRFRGRLMFPIFDARGQVVAFGGRVLPGAAGDEPKYLNSPETEIFKKGHILYPLHLAKESMRAGNRAILVEGYMDAVSAHQAGFGEVVAGLGTALTPDQARLILGYCPEVVLAYDADTAGSQATLRGLEIFSQMGGRVRVAVLPEGEDPDSLIRQEGAGAFAGVIASSRPLMEYLLDRAVAGADLGSVAARATVLKKLAPTLAAVANVGEREEYLVMVARRLGFTTEVVRAEVRRAASQARAGEGPARARVQRSEHIRAEARNNNEDAPETETGSNGATDRSGDEVRSIALQLLELALAYPDVTELLAHSLEQSPDLLPEKDLRVLAEAAVSSWNKRHTVDMRLILAAVGDNEEAQSILARLTAAPPQVAAEAAMRTAADCLAILAEQKLSAVAARLERDLAGYMRARVLPPVEWFDEFRKVVPPGREGVQ